MKKFMISFSIFVLWFISGAMFIMAGSFISEGDQAWVASAGVGVVLCVSFWYAGRKLQNKFKTGFQVCYAVAVCLFLFMLIMIPEFNAVEIVCGIAAALAFAGYGIWMDKKGHKFTTEEPEQLPPFSKPQLAPPPFSQKVTNQPLERQFLQRLANLNNIVKNTQIKNQISVLHASGTQILDFAFTNPEQAHEAVVFKEYYLPKTVQLLEQYAMFSQKAVKSENMVESMEKIASAVDNMEKIFKHCLNKMYGDLTQDISADIDALEQMMSLECIE